MQRRIKRVLEANGFRQWGDTFDESKFKDLASAMVDIFAGQFPGFQSLLNDACASNKRRSTERQELISRSLG